MINKFIRTVEKFNMLSKGDRVVVGVSGGADSMLLLHLLQMIKNDYSLSILVAHVEHGIRGKASVEDAQFVEEYCKKNMLEYRLLQINAPREAKDNKLSVEEYSRKRRYEFFKTFDCDKIATAHNLSDNIETVLFRLSRGTGLKGACGIPPVRGKIIRPLIEISSSDIRRYCDNYSIPYRNDETNFTNEYSRNFIRNEIVASFKDLNSSFEENFSRFIISANEDYEFIDNAAEDALSLFCNDYLDTDKLSKFPTAVCKRVILKHFDRNAITLDYSQLEEVYSLVFKSGKVQLSGDIFAVSSGKRLRIADLSEKENNKKFKTEILKKIEFNPKTVDFFCDYDKINGSAVIRFREPGDALKPEGRRCTKTLKDLFNELKIPVEQRDNIFVICDDNGVIGIEGICCDERVKIDSNTENVFVLTVFTED